MFLVFNTTLRLERIASVYAGPNDPQIGSRDVQSGFRVNHMNEADRAWDAYYKACNRDASAAPEEFGYSGNVTSWHWSL
jgi:hypothetical protein